MMSKRASELQAGDVVQADDEAWPHTIKSATVGKRGVTVAYTNGTTYRAQLDASYTLFAHGNPGCREKRACTCTGCGHAGKALDLKTPVLREVA